jgi:hypothetical protein
MITDKHGVAPMLSLVIENSKIVMLFFLVGTIIGLSYFGGEQDQYADNGNSSGDNELTQS